MLVKGFTLILKIESIKDNIIKTSKVMVKGLQILPNGKVRKGQFKDGRYVGKRTKFQ